MNALLETRAAENTKAFDWPLCYEAERLLGGYVDAFLKLNPFAARLAQRMNDETGTEFFEWIDHLVISRQHADELHRAGFIEENVEVPAGATVLWHPRAMMPRVLLRDEKSSINTPAEVAIRPELLADFLAAQDLDTPIEGAFGARLRRALVSEENGTKLSAVERLGHRGFVVREPTPILTRVLRVRGYGGHANVISWTTHSA